MIRAPLAPRHTGRLRADLARVVGPGAVVTDPVDLLAYRYDASLDQATPDAVVLPSATREVQGVCAVAKRWNLPVVPRGAGTGLSGGAIASAGGIVVAMTRMNKILEIDAENARATVQPGVRNSALGEAAAPFGLFYAPDPSSQRASTLGGNVAENAGGAHCLAYGVTSNYVLALELVTIDGEALWLDRSAPGFDLAGVVCGAEGTLGIVTAITVGLRRRPEAVSTMLAAFGSLEAAGAAVSSILSAGIVPTAMEVMDRDTVHAVEPFAHAGYPLDAEGLVLIEVEGLADGLPALTEEIREHCLEFGATSVRLAKTEDERARLWAGRKGVAGALGRYAPAYYVVDGMVPRSKLPQALLRVQEAARRFGLRIVTVCHAGDGNIHPTIVLDPREPGIKERVLAAGAFILEYCVELGGALSGEHGIGLEKRDLMRRMFSPADLEAMRRVRRAFDPSGLMNPGKVLPEA